MSRLSFSQLDLPANTLANLKTLGFEQMTEIQAQGLPPVLDGRDVVGRAKTGSGKTAVFGLGLLASLQPANFQVQALVLCPTRELADQVAQEIRRLAQGIPNVKLLVICGGKPMGPQKASLKHGAHIVVGTPGRVLDHLGKGSLRLDKLRTLVLDEADRMLDMGFADEVTDIVARAPKPRQTLLFSATFPDAIVQMSASIQSDPLRISVDVDHAPGVIDQLFFEIKRNERNQVLLGLLAHYAPGAAVVFCHTRKQCAEVASFLNDNRVEAVALHGELDHLDIKSLPAVINYELPHDPEVYVHRIGRTGRAGQQGVALSLVTQNEIRRVRQIEEFTGSPCLMDVPASLDQITDFVLRGRMGTLKIEGGKKAKMRKGDLLGALTGDAGLEGSQIGKIDLFDYHALVAIDRDAIKKALGFFAQGKVKGRSVRARRIS